jgi:hypothetical protein
MLGRQRHGVRRRAIHDFIAAAEAVDADLRRHDEVVGHLVP